MSFGYLAWNSKLCLMPKLSHFLIRNAEFPGRPSLRSARCPPAGLQEPPRRALINWRGFPAGEQRLHLLRRPAPPCLPLAAQLGLSVHEPEDPPGVTAASELLCPPVPDAAVREEGVGPGAREAGVLAGTRPALAEPASPSPRETDAAREAGAPGGLVAPAPGAAPRADLSALRH